MLHLRGGWKAALGRSLQGRINPLDANAATDLMAAVSPNSTVPEDW
ncbi:hypothetical protein Z947_1692 [Sulfitobacter geojensis]|nr:hypothetical protein Z947_1692 [Sulfitobacter geojensis]